MMATRTWRGGRGAWSEEGAEDDGADEIEVEEVEAAESPRAGRSCMTTVQSSCPTESGDGGSGWPRRASRSRVIHRSHRGSIVLRAEKVLGENNLFKIFVLD